MKLSRDLYRPSYSPSYTNDKLGIEVYTEDKIYGGTVRYVLHFFAGKRSKPDMNFYFTRAEDRQRKIDDYIKRLEEIEQDRVNRRKERNSFVHSLKVGDILYSSWGYDQTNIDFYQVVGLVGKKQVKIKQIASKGVEDTGYCSRMVVAVKDSFVGEEMRKLVSTSGYCGDGVKIASYASAHLWDGKPKNETSYA